MTGIMHDVENQMVHMTGIMNELLCMTYLRNDESNIDVNDQPSPISACLAAVRDFRSLSKGIA